MGFSVGDSGEDTDGNNIVEAVSIVEALEILRLLALGCLISCCPWFRRLFKEDDTPFDDAFDTGEPDRDRRRGEPGGESDEDDIGDSIVLTCSPSAPSVSVAIEDPLRR